jgi:dipeptidyl aminopeptidase/acylaminoacyl peptidase
MLVAETRLQIRARSYITRGIMPRTMSHRPLPIERLYLAHEVSEPCFGETSAEIFFVRRMDARRSIVRQRLDTGLSESVTTEPRPAGGIGYGGGVFAVRGSTLVYAASDGRIHAIDLRTGVQHAVTPAYDGVAAPAFSPCGRMIAFLCEHGARCNVLVADVDGRSLPVKITDDPWYAFNPVFSPDGTRMAWQEWDQLDMPWDQSRLRVAKLARSTDAVSTCREILPAAVVATIARKDTSYSGPQWNPDGSRLAFVTDESGWRSLWVGGAHGENAARLDTGEGEIGLPDWLPGRYGYRWSDDGSAIYAVRSRTSRDSLLRIAWPQGTVEEIPSGSSDLQGLAVRGHSIAYTGAAPLEPARLMTRIAGGKDPRPGTEVPRVPTLVGLIDRESLSEPEVLSWPTTGGVPCWGIFYPAAGPDAARAPRPLLVHMHGGPTSQMPFTWAGQAQYYATRGWHYLIVNHRGGTGYGRAYQDLLRGAWGVVDLEDARSGAEHAIRTLGADPRRVVVTGGSAGGYSTLWALTQQPDFWTAGVALCPLAHIYDAVVGAHRFERHYEETLMGRLPEAGPVWQERSPITYADRVKAPLLLFHGLDDRAVPHQQSVDFRDAVRRHGGTVELVSYEGEGHVFAKEATRRDVIERMERFLEKHVLALQR